MAYLLPIGPWHPALDEPIIYKLEVAEGKIDRVEIELGFNHRGVEGLLPCLLPHQILSTVSHLCGKCSYANSIAVATALESLAGLEVPWRVQYLRTVAAELERAVSHLTNSAKTLRMLGVNILAGRFEEEAEGVRQLLAATGNRVYDTFTLLGGAMRPIQLPLEFQTAVERLRKNIYESVSQLLDNHQLERHIVTLGYISPEIADEYALVGPIARASDIPDDIRRSYPYAAYGELDFRVVTQTGGNLFSRLAVRLLETLESLNLVGQALRAKPEGNLKEELLPSAFPANMEVSAMVETPRGALFVYVAADEKGQLTRIKLRPPTLVNLPALPVSLLSQELEDAAALLVSLDYCFACAER
jgi:NADH-quinone oxidoreductase subunit D